MFYVVNSFNLPVLPDNAEEWKVLCKNENCFAHNHGLISVVKIEWLIRCTCCGQAHDSFYFENQLKKVGVL